VRNRRRIGRAVFVLFARHRMHASDLVLGLVDAALGLMFLVTFVRLRRAK
jgi:hypothetical protein